MSKHTKGPWIVCVNDVDKSLSIEQDRLHTDCEPTTVVMCIDDMGDGLDRSTGEANARLIAAAPDLLEALRECVTDDNANCIVTSDVCYMIRRFKAINAIVKTAVAKAEGRD